MADFNDELSLLYCLLLNAAVFGSTWFFARRRMTASRSQAALDAALLGYAVQYVSIGIPGLLGCLNFQSVTVIAVICAIGLFATARKVTPVISPVVPIRDRLVISGAFFFVTAFVLAFAHKQADLPPISNDAMTYHFPAAVQWLQQGWIGLFQTWFFNPSNTYSPLAGSIFILWLILPFGNDVLARFVEVPALLCVGLAMYQLCREIGARAAIAALIAAAVVLCRPIFLPCMMGKDDLFVAFFIIASLVALSKNRASENWGAVRFGIALGLLLATKYTALLCVPILLFSIDAPKWPAKKWTINATCALLLAGPWYFRNWITTGNPLFPLGSLFTSARSDAFHSVVAAVHTVLGGEYGLPFAIAIAMGIGLIITILARFFTSRVPSGRGISEVSNNSDASNDPQPEGARLLPIHRCNTPIVRACSIGSAVAIALFFWRSPFPEVRFLLPAFCLLFVCIAFSIERFCRPESLAIAIGLAIVGLSLGTLFAGLFVTVTLPFGLFGLLVVGMGVGATWWAGDRRVRKILIIGIVATAFFICAYINWSAFCVYQRQTRFVDGAGYSAEYPDLTRLWNFVDQNLSANATMAYTNLYFVYPLQGGSLHRRLVYCPTRPGVNSVADLGWLGKNLSGEQLVPAAIHATVSAPNRDIWLSNLHKCGAKYLIVGRNGLIDVPVEVGFAGADPSKFTLLFRSASGWVYRMNDSPLAASRMQQRVSQISN